ncbi:MAG: SRPBCC domain-containing protein [Nitrosopumilus sp.]|nr:SRPBCC domain-containing protein [Nitrosopumilus sp.]
MKTIQQKINFNVPAKKLFQTYIDAKKHSESINAKVTIKNKTNTKFTSWDNYISGKNLHLVPYSLIVQSWRTQDWNKRDPDSILILSFLQNAKNSTIEMIHVNVPDSKAAELKTGWNEYYWKPWKKYFKT